MKFRNLVKIMVLCASIGVTALAAEQTNKVESKTLGTELKEYGKIYNKDGVLVVHKQLKKGEKIPPHTHKYKELFFTVVSGKMEVQLNDKETYIVEPKKALNFAGDVNISATALEDSDIFIYLVGENK
ncbi:cupin domain-containing protein [Fusobacterium polymorphum]|jgi:hypothetical protein|uniref:Cupin type-2 domain-containing protein n=1 Tax=Fusobacterium nucleatum subsp. polymorphum TaxID=76857 RepID=A0A2C6C3U4_FUSNP|nr:cupin domain-containing protein [Fusobacterium polymorphum]PHI11094.1 hypothetical protein CBG56_10795 [Fusobacterium polymorphum]